MPYYRKNNMKGYKTKTYNTYGVTTGDVTSAHQNKKRSEDQDKLNKKKRKKKSKGRKYFEKGLRPSAARKAGRDNTYDMVNALHKVFGIPIQAPKTKSYRRAQKIGRFYNKYGRKHRKKP